MKNQTVRVKIPASTANLGPGFDALGMAFQLYTTISMRISDTTTIQLHGKELEGIPQDKSNLLYEVASFLFQEAQMEVPELAMEVETDVPLTRGLGSSASAIVGALVGANVLAGNPFSYEQLYYFASKWEGHPDNVGASFFGGIIVATMPGDDESKQIPYVRFPVPAGLKTLVVIPNYFLATEKARNVLPEKYDKSDIVFNIGRSSLLVAALATGNLDLLGTAMQDRVHQPYRCQLVPGLEEMLEKSTGHGAIGAALSGAGPTVLFFYNGENEREKLVYFVETVMAKHQITYDLLDLLPDENGVEVDVFASIGS
ncbi:homoserine kinase [Brevibacillus sp. SYSU BS000544]|uniref:homoserine kinase n=1 Tax=Brevibacillus sp. SYSU BS000544 TaxID=3416443 RepID=UPI003CE52A14